MKVVWDGEEHELTEFIAGMADECYQGRYDVARVLREIDDPRFDNYYTPSWQDKVPAGFIKNWGHLSREFRLAVFAMAIIQ